MNNGQLRAASGEIDDKDAFVSLLYSLLRDYVHPGDMERLVQDIEDACARGNHVTKYTNGWLAQYAQLLARRLRECDAKALRDQ